MGAFRKGYKSAWWLPSSLTYKPVEARVLEERYKAWLVSTGRVKADDYARAEVEDSLRYEVQRRRSSVEIGIKASENYLRRAEADLVDERAIQSAALDRAVQNYIDAQRPQTKDTTTNGGEIKTYQRKEILFGGDISVRVVPCFTQASGRYQQHYQMFNDGSERAHWMRTGGAGVTTYWVMVAGRMVDSFLSQAPAVAVARELVKAMSFDERYPLPQEKRA